MADTVPLIMPDGAIREFKARDAEFHIKHNGWLPATEENLKIAKLRQDNSGIVGTGKAALESLARGLTGGASDWAETKLGVDPAAIQAREDANPTTSTIGQFAGAAGGFAVPEAAAGKLLGPAVSWGSKLLRAVGGGAVAGGLMGAGGAAGESALTNQPLTAEMLGHGAMNGALFGAATGGAAQLAADAVGAVGRVTGKRVGGIVERADKLVNPAADTPEELLRQAGASGKQIGKLQDAPGDLINRVTGHLKEKGYLSQDPQSAFDAAMAGTKEVGGKLGGILETGAPSSGEDLATTFAKLGKKDEFDKFSAPWKKDLREYADVFQRKADAGTDISAGELQRVKMALDKEIKRRSAAGNVAPAELFEAKKAVIAQMESAIPAASRDEFAALKEQYGTSKEVEKILKQRRDQAVGQAANKGELDVGKDLLGGLNDNGVRYGALGATAFGHPVAGATLFASNMLKRLAVAPENQKWIAKQVLNTRDFLQGLTDAADGSIGKMLKTVVAPVRASTAAGAIYAGTHPVSDYARISQAVINAKDDINGVAARTHVTIGDEINNSHPEVADIAAQTVQRGVDYLHQEMPKPALPQGVMDTEWQPSATAKAQWLDKYRAVNDPASVVRNPTADSMQALQMVYPAFHEQVLKQMQQQLMNNPNVSYQAKLKLAKFVPTLSTMTNPEFVQQMQNLYQHMEAQKQPQQGQQGSARTARAKQMNVKKIATDEATQFNQFQEH